MRTVPELTEQVCAQVQAPREMLSARAVGSGAGRSDWIWVWPRWIRQTKARNMSAATKSTWT